MVTATNLEEIGPEKHIGNFQGWVSDSLKPIYDKTCHKLS